MIAKLLIGSVACAAAFQAPLSRTVSQPTISMSMKPAEAFRLPAAATALAITLHSEAAHAKSIVGVNGGLDFGPLAGDQPGGEGTGKALGINDDSLGFVLLGVTLAVGFAFAQWQSYQDDADDFFDS